MSTSKFHDEKTKQNKKYVKEKEKSVRSVFNEIKEGCLFEQERKSILREQ